MTNFIKEELEKLKNKYGFILASDNPSSPIIKEFIEDVTASHLRLLERVEKRLEEIKKEGLVCDGTENCLKGCMGSAKEATLEDVKKFINELKSIE